MIEKFKAMDTKQKILVVGGGILVLFFLIKAISGGSRGTSSSVTSAPGQDANDIAQALNSSLTSQLDAQNASTAKALDMIMNQIETNDRLQSDALSKSIEALTKNQELSNEAFIGALNGITGQPQVDYSALFDGKFSGLNDQLAGLGAMNASLVAQLQALQTRTQTIQSNPNPTVATNYQSGSGYTNAYNNSSALSQSALNQAKDAVLSNGNYSQQTQNYISGLTGSQSQSSMQQAAQTAESNLSALQAARDAYKGTSASTPGVPQASVAKVEVVGRK